MIYLDDKGRDSIQIASTEPTLIADITYYFVENSTQIIDANMGCQRPKVNEKLTISALLTQFSVIGPVLKAIMYAGDIFITPKIHTNLNLGNTHYFQIVKLTTDCSIQKLVLHRYTHVCMYKGEAKYDSVRAFKRSLLSSLSSMLVLSHLQNSKQYCDILVQTS
nr:tRNA-dihydrouridine synthase [Candidatus Enterovibrio luxaltus]